MSVNALGLYRPGSSLLHRCGAGGKLLLLLLAGCATGLAPALGPAQLWLSGTILGLGIAAWTVARLPLQQLAKVLLVVGVLVLALAAVQWWSNGPVAAVGTAARVFGLILLAWAVTASTRVSALLQVISRVLAPLRRLGLRTDRIGLAVALTVRAIPLIGDGWRRAREARIARSAPTGLRGLPGMVIATVVHAIRLSDAMGEALIARGGVD